MVSLPSPSWLGAFAPTVRTWESAQGAVTPGLVSFQAISSEAVGICQPACRHSRSATVRIKCRPIGPARRQSGDHLGSSASCSVIGLLGIGGEGDAATKVMIGDREPRVALHGRPTHAPYCSVTGAEPRS